MKLKNPTLSISLILGGILSALLIWNSWHTSVGEIKKVNKPVTAQMQDDKKLVSYTEFLGAAFSKIKPPQNIEEILNIKPESWTLKQIEVLIKWSRETQNGPLYTIADNQMRINQKMPNAEATNALQNAMYAQLELENSGNPKISNYFFQQAQQISEHVLNTNSQNISARQAKILVMANYDQAKPMEFLALLKETVALDSSNVVTHSIHLSLLKRTNQWAKALEKCKKLVSLQPQNPDWMFETSDIYGKMGDSTNAKKYMELGIKQSKTNK